MEAVRHHVTYGSSEGDADRRPKGCEILPMAFANRPHLVEYLIRLMPKHYWYRFIQPDSLSTWAWFSKIHVI